MKQISKRQLFFISLLTSILIQKPLAHATAEFAGPNAQHRVFIAHSALHATHLAQADLNAIINGLQAKYSRMKGLAADFVQVYHTTDGRTRRESGTLLLKRPGRAKWNYLSPERKVFVSDGKNVFFHVSGEKYATRSTVKQSVDPQIPFLFLLGRGNIRRDFSSIEVTRERPVEPGNVVLRLVPKRAPDDFKQILAEVSPQRFTVNRLVIIERTGARMDFYLSNVQENHVAADDEFRFTPPAGVSIRQAQ